MHSVLLYAVSLWDIAESRVWGADMIPRNHWGDPLVLMNVSRGWGQFIASSPQLWSYVLIDTDDEDVLEYLQLFLLLSRNRRLFIVLHGSGDVCGDIMVHLLQVGDRIDTLVYPPNISRSTLARFRIYLGTSHDQLEDVCRWCKLEVQSGTQPQRYLHYTLPISTQSLCISGLFPLSRLVTLSDFQSLSFLSVRISHDRALPPARNYRLELPKLEVLRVQMTLGSHDQVDTPINMVCRNLKLLDLQYTLELDIKNTHKQPAIWMEFSEVDGVEELQIDLAIHSVTEVGSIQSLTERLPRLERLKGREQRREWWEQRRGQRLEELKQLKGREWEMRMGPWNKRLVQWREQQGQLKRREQRLDRLDLRLEQWEQRLEQRLERLEQLEQLEQWEQLEQRLEELLEEMGKLEAMGELLLREQKRERWKRELERQERQWLWEVEQEQQAEERWLEQRQVEQWLEQQWLERLERLEQLLLQEQELLELLRELREWRGQQVQYLRFTKSICTHWREWLNLPNSLTRVQRSSLNVTLSTRIHQGTCRVMRNVVEDLLVRNLPQLTELTTSNLLPIFPRHLRKLRFRGFHLSDSPPPITLPSLVSLEIIVDSPDHLRVMA